MSDRFWSVVRGSVTAAGREHEEPLNEWWSYEHMPDFVALPGFRRAWRLRTIVHGAQIGDPGQHYSAVYEIDSIDAFGAALEAFQPPWGPWQEYIDDWLIDWSRTYYRLRQSRDGGNQAGGFWAIVKASLSLESLEQEAEFNAWWADKHVPEICDNPGIHRAWRLELEPHEDVVAPAPHRFWAVYQIDTPESFVAARDRRAERGIEPWDGIWLPYLEDWGISFHQIMHHVTHDSAASGGIRSREGRPET